MATRTVGIYPPLGRLQSSGLHPALAYFLASRMFVVDVLLLVATLHTVTHSGLFLLFHALAFSAGGGSQDAA